MRFQALLAVLLVCAIGPGVARAEGFVAAPLPEHCYRGCATGVEIEGDASSGDVVLTLWATGGYCLVGRTRDPGAETPPPTPEGIFELLENGDQVSNLTSMIARLVGVGPLEGQGVDCDDMARRFF